MNSKLTLQITFAKYLITTVMERIPKWELPDIVGVIDPSPFDEEMKTAIRCILLKKETECAAQYFKQFKGSLLTDAKYIKFFDEYLCDAFENGAHYTFIEYSLLAATYAYFHFKDKDLTASAVKVIVNAIEFMHEDEDWTNALKEHLLYFRDNAELIFKPSIP